MSRKEDKSKDKDGSTATLSVDIEDFTRTRDNVILGLATLQSAVSDLSRAYINHANTVLNRGPSTLDISGITSSLFENGLFGAGAAAAAAAAGARAASPGARSEAGGKKKRKRFHDPNAPKRALTPYFLYLTTNRKTVAQELGGNAKPKEVSEECTRRWGEMSDSEKKHWKDLYAENLAAYHEKVKAYKAGLPVPDDNAAADAASEQLQQGVRQATDDASSSEESQSSAESTPSPSPSPEPAKEPTPPPSRPSKRRRESKATPIETPVSKRASPEKKKKGKEDKVEKLKRSVVPETPKSERKSSRKKRKSEINGDD